jgi:hypothetical protein
LLWGVSHLAVVPVFVAIALVFFASGLCLFARRWGQSLTGLRFPGRRGAAFIATSCTPAFWLLRERLHFFGDGYLLI